VLIVTNAARPIVVSIWIMMKKAENICVNIAVLKSRFGRTDRLRSIVKPTKVKELL